MMKYEMWKPNLRVRERLASPAINVVGFKQPRTRKASYTWVRSYTEYTAMNNYRNYLNEVLDIFRNSKVYLENSDLDRKAEIELSDFRTKPLKKGTAGHVVEHRMTFYLLNGSWQNLNSLTRQLRNLQAGQSENVM